MRQLRKLCLVVVFALFAGSMLPVNAAQISDTLTLAKNSDLSTIIDPVGCGGLCVLTLFEGGPETNNGIDSLDIVFIKNGCCFITGSETVYLTEPGFPSVVSDIVTLTVTEYNHDLYDINIRLQSDSPTSNLTIPVNTPTSLIFPEMAKDDLTAKLFDSRTLAAGSLGSPFHVILESDGDTPEPGSLLLAGAGLLAVVLLSRRRRMRT